MQSYAEKNSEVLNSFVQYFIKSFFVGNRILSSNHITSHRNVPKVKQYEYDFSCNAHIKGLTAKSILHSKSAF